MAGYQDPSLTIHQRVVDLMEQMTLAEKVGQVNQHLYGWKSFQAQKGSWQLTDYFKEHVAWGGGMGALYGLFRADPWSQINERNGIAAKDSGKLANDIQNYVISHSRLGIPVLLAEECPHGHQGLQSVSYPTNIGRGNSFNQQLIKETSQEMAQELAQKGVHLALVSTLDLSRDPRWGRTEECFGEDPYIAGRFSEAIVSGFQGDLITDKPFVHQTVAEIQRQPAQIGVVLKHCLAQGDAIGGHNSGAVNIGQREFMDVYYPLLKRVKQAVGVMAAYNDIDGIPCHANPYLLEKLLRETIKYQGLVMADGTALDRLVQIYGSQEAAAYHGLKAGVDLSLWDQTYLTIGNSVTANIMTEGLLDKAVYRVLSIKFLLGLFDNPYVAEEPSGYLTLAAQQQKNLKMAEESLTLVKNEDCLPLADQGEKIAVIGPNGNDIYHLLGDYTAPQTEEMLQQTVYQGIKQAFPHSDVSFAQGCEVRNTENQQGLLEEALTLAEASDKIILVLGGSSARNFDMEFLSNGAVSSKGINMDSGENVDLASLTLGGKQVTLFRALQKLNKPIISVFVQGRPHDIAEIVEGSAAVLIAWYPGQMGGQAIGHVLSGKTNPSGKLSVSYPRNSGQLPVYYYQRDIAMNQDYYDEVGSPLYEFGYGLSYTQFSYQKLQAPPTVSKASMETEGTIKVRVEVKNTGPVAGEESVLLFIQLQGGTVIQRKKLLRGFEKVTLAPQEKTVISFILTFEDICYYDSENKFSLSDSLIIEIGSCRQKITLT